MICYYTTFPSHLGQFTLAVDTAGAVVATAFGDTSALLRRIQCRLTRDTVRTAPAQRQLAEYFRGTRREFDLPLAPAGTEFQRRVWAQLGRIPYGTTRTYADIARAIGAPAAARAVGRANATNPICVIVPCHRVIGTDGSLTGFAFGESVKRDLLELEAQRSRATAAA